jgi:pseudouridine synthase
MRLNKFLATGGVASRRGADELITEGHVRVNGRVVTALGTRIDPEADKVFVDEHQIVLLDEPVYIVFNKPKDCITTAKDERGRTTVMDYVKVKERVFPVGRLDRNTTGVLLLTNDGEFANRLMHPRHQIKKAYTVTLDKPLERPDAAKLQAGIRLSDGKTEPAEIHFIPTGKNKVIGVVIHEGKNRQVHRMFEALDYAVAKLDRVAYAGITYEGVPRGRWRKLTRQEERSLKRAAGMEEEL